jgi:hypothetical protein
MRTNNDVISILNTKAQWNARKVAVEQQVQSCEEHLQSLRGDLLEADRNLQEVQSCFDTFILQVQAPVRDKESFSGRANALSLSDASDSSEDSASNSGDLA